MEKKVPSELVMMQSDSMKQRRGICRCERERLGAAESSIGRQCMWSRSSLKATHIERSSDGDLRIGLRFWRFRCLWLMLQWAAIEDGQLVHAYLTGPGTEAYTGMRQREQNDDRAF